MTNISSDVHAIWQRAGSERIAQPDWTYTRFPFRWDDSTPFRHTFEYSVTEFETEVGFYSSIFGFETVALDDSYALFTSPQRDFWLSIRRASVESPESNPSGLFLMFMSHNFPIVRDHLERVGAGLVIADRVEPGGLRVSKFLSPAGLAIELWEDPT
ncbi:MAG: hypothetical protein WKF81_12530 [Thermomicrobiales bacterium]